MLTTNASGSDVLVCKTEKQMRSTLAKLDGFFVVLREQEEAAR